MDNENLTDMIKRPEEPVRFSEEDLDTPENVRDDTQSIPESPEEESQTIDVIKTVALSTWFEQNHERFDNVNHVKVAIRGIDSSKTLIMSVSTLDQTESQKRKLFIFEDADITPVLDLPGLAMDVFSNGFKIIYNYNDIFLKCYGVKTGLFVVFCKNIDNQIISYAITKVKRKDSSLVVIHRNTEDLMAKLVLPEDTESLQILYKQIVKHIGEIKTKQDTVNWFLERQKTVMDINHHLQIDNILIRSLQ